MVNLKEYIRDEKLLELTLNLMGTIQAVSKKLHNGEFESGQNGTLNEFGDLQLKADKEIDDMISSNLPEYCSLWSSEEHPNMNYTREGEPLYSVAYDPLDGSSIFDANLTVGTIVSVWPGNFMNQTGHDQAIAIMAVYGPKTTIALAVNDKYSLVGRTCIELTLINGSWKYIKTFAISDSAKTFSPGNLRYVNKDETYKELVNHWIDGGYTLRYTGGLVPDIFHMLSKGQGVLTNIPSKLRLVYECCAIALIVEASGGKSSNFKDGKSVLSLPITDLNEIVGVCFGSSKEVELFNSKFF
ncbi:hypothetical protein HDV04_005708 [Boothiomyces sp. JEL0838]|nr:hypothetical protein HDV04_005708 [Boothiomyces sp. JEL0838]